MIETENITIKQLRSKLTTNQLKFADNILDGLKQSPAYKLAFPKAKTDTTSSSTRLMKDVRIRQYLEAIRDKEATANTLSRQRKREILFNLAEAKVKDSRPNDRISAIKEDNLMTGDNAPVKFKGELTIGSIMAGLSDTTGLPDK